MAKPLKNRVASKDRNRLQIERREILLRLGFNLRLKQSSIRAVKATITAPLQEFEKNLDDFEATLYQGV
jgi:hypothetical protein